MHQICSTNVLVHKNTTLPGVAPWIPSFTALFHPLPLFPRLRGISKACPGQGVYVRAEPAATCSRREQPDLPQTHGSREDRRAAEKKIGRTLMFTCPRLKLYENTLLRRKPNVESIEISHKVVNLVLWKKKPRKTWVRISFSAQFRMRPWANKMGEIIYISGLGWGLK